MKVCDKCKNPISYGESIVYYDYCRKCYEKALQVLRDWNGKK